MTLPAAFRGSRAAFVFLTRLPLGGFPYSSEDWRWAPAHFPLVGIGVGSFGAVVWWLAQSLGPFLAASLAVAATVWATGAFHEDGLADTADALGGAHGKRRIFEILKDSRIGAYGATALVLSLLIRVGALAELGAAAVPTLVAVHGVARTGPVWLMAFLPYVSGEEGKGSAVSRGVGVAQAVCAAGWMGVACACGLWGGLAPTLVVAWPLLMVVTTWCLGRWFFSRAGGVTGDFLGATEQGNETTLLLLAVLAVRNVW